MQILLAIFTIAAGLLYLEVFATRVLAIAIGSRYVFHTIAIAMLGMGAASAMVSLVREVDTHRGLRIATFASLAAGLGALLLFVGTAIYCGSNALRLDAFVGKQGDYIEMSLGMDRIGMLVIGLLMLIPYGAVGTVLAVVFRIAPPRLASRWYGVDLIGACTGAFLAIFALDQWSFGVSAIAACMLPAIAAILFASATGQRKVVRLASGGVVALCLLIGVASSFDGLEPRPPLSAMARTWQSGGGAREVWSTWTSYGRIAALRVQKGFEESTLMAHGRGEGHARIVEPGEELAPKPLRLLYASKAAITACEPERVLVLFAGAGADMRIIDALTGGRAELIRGVELIEEVFAWPARQPSTGLGEFLARPHIDLVAAEAREYLARDDSRYDCILVSWFGASLGYFTGVNSNATSSVYTVEGMTEILRHLEPDGQLTVLNGDKAQLLLAVVPALRAIGVDEPGGSVAILSQLDESTDYEHSIYDWLVVKPSGFSSADLAAFGETVPRRIIDFAGPHSEEFHHALLRDPAPMIGRVVAEHGTDISPATDDRPFADNLVPAQALLSTRFWLGDVEGIPQAIGLQWLRDRGQMLTTLGFIGLSVLLILGPVGVLRGRRIDWPDGAVNDLVYFSSVGAGFMLIEIGMIQKLRLLVGHPGHTIAVVLASILLFTGVGSLVSRTTFVRGWASFRSMAAVVVVATIAVTWLFEASAGTLVGLPYGWKLFIAFLLPAIPCIPMGHLFPQGLAALRGGPLVPWAIAVNALTGTIMTGLGIFLGKHIGFRSVILLGCACYVLVVLISHRHREEGVRAAQSE